MLSVVIPTLNAANSLGPVLSALGGAGFALEVLVVDGGSRDFTTSVAERLGVPVLRTSPGRGHQMALGARRTGGEWLLFLHGDTLLQPGWAGHAWEFMNNPVNRRRAAAFRLRFDDDHPAARRVERLADWRCRHLGLPYGDQGLLIRREFYEDMGGFADMPLMEDVELVRRIGKDRLVLLDACALTSAVRYRRGGWTLRPLRNLCCLGLYFLGLPPRHIAKLYG